MPPNWNEHLSQFILILRTAQTAALFTPFPQVQQVTGLVLQLLQSVDKVRRCKGDCESLALRALEMVSVILYEAQNHGPLSPEMESRVVKLAEVLNDITHFMREQAKAPFLCRFLRQVNIQDQLDSYRVRLEDAFKLFDVCLWLPSRPKTSKSRSPLTFVAFLDHSPLLSTTTAIFEFTNVPI
ncbi:hypothetical protein JAAARDRAFT_660592 [Jaapia argillacea MUCL 33604]|uniref:Uncharacterized protein n=1 Tax=Jaapia argillacea MUCL 33604 TaxID=933084 RepID=A0A067Q7A4_9AGAM|nr:hypothetical protein JAAARDRAFT_660592 [Jaapia argillacea MUCL 33604]